MARAANGQLARPGILERLEADKKEYARARPEWYLEREGYGPPAPRAVLEADAAREDAFRERMKLPHAEWLELAHERYRRAGHAIPARVGPLPSYAAASKRLRACIAAGEPFGLAVKVAPVRKPRAPRPAASPEPLAAELAAALERVRQLESDNDALRAELRAYFTRRLEVVA